MGSWGDTRSFLLGVKMSDHRIPRGRPFYVRGTQRCVKNAMK